jgi:DNA-directed RNA polymerase subunit RPC12/RpoP
MTATSKKQETMTCPSCQTDLVSEQLEGYSGKTRMWRCPCGFRRVVAESGVIVRPTDLVTQ